MCDIYPDLEEETQVRGTNKHPKVERSNSTATNTSGDSMLSPPVLYTNPLDIQIETQTKSKTLLTTEVIFTF